VLEVSDVTLAPNIAHQIQKGGSPEYYIDLVYGENAAEAIQGSIWPVLIQTYF
jgi:hypothetical protein